MIKSAKKCFEQTSKEIESEKKDIQDKIARYDIRIEEFFSNMKKNSKNSRNQPKNVQKFEFFEKKSTFKNNNLELFYRWKKCSNFNKKAL